MSISWCLRRSVRAAAACCLLCGPFAGLAHAQEPSPGADLTKASLEDLLNIKVTSVSKTEQKLSRTAAAVFVITQDDIQHSGALNIPDLLRMVPGVDVAQIDANKWAVSIRGLNGLYSNELLVLLDGRTVYTPTFGGVQWDVLDVPLEDIERIEVIRGPGGAMWGANAVNGVINILTKKASATRGAMAVAGGGSKLPEFGTLQYGGGAGKATDYRVFAKYFNEDRMPGPGGAQGFDGWHVLRGGFRADSSVSSKDSLTFEGDIYGGREGIVSPVLASVTSPAPQQTNLEVDLSGGYFQTVWNHVSSSRSDTTLQFSYDRYERDDILNERRGTFDLTFQHHIMLGNKHDLVWGAEYRNSGAHSDGSLFITLHPADIRTQLFGAFIQDEIALFANRLYLTLGMKLEHNYYSGFNVMPTVRIAWLPTVHQTAWAAVSRGVRTPAETDAAIRLNFGSVPGPGGTPALISLFGNPAYQDENLLAFESGYRATFNSDVSLDLAAYYDLYTSQQTQEPGPAYLENSPGPPHYVYPSTYDNLMSGEAHGVEAFLNWKVTNRWFLSPGYAFEQVYMHLSPGSQDTSSVGESDGSAPVNSAQLRSHLSLGHGFSWDASAYFVGRIANPVVPSYTRLDSGLTWRPLEHFSVGVFGQNLLKDQHLEYLDIKRSVVSTLIERTVFGRVAWSF